ncbi:cytochrome b5-like heme/steroid binding domain-containing protein [Mycena sanguinolenta]|nr:cytochrome b5-like heme/steroid binding domain-containing protein [Mycena sanguinolenta]
MSPSKKTVSLADLRTHNTKENCWVLINGKVYDCTKFLDEHPGGDEIILAESGKDATESFQDAGHSNDATEMLPEMLVGDFVDTS